MTGLIYSIIKFNTEFLMRVVAILIGINSKITYDNYNGLSRAYYISLCLIIVWPFCIYLCGIKREDVNIVQVVIQHLDQAENQVRKEVSMLEVIKLFEESRKTNRTVDNDFELMAAAQREARKISVQNE